MALMLLLTTGSVLHLQAQAQPFKLASDVWPPFTDVPGKSRVACEIVEMALDEAGYATDVTIVEFSAVISGVKEGKFDGGVAFWRDPEREEYLSYSRAYLENHLVLVGTKGTDVSATTWEELAGRRIGYLEDYAYNVEETGDAGPIWVMSKNVQENLARLWAGEIDCTVMDSIVVQQLATNLQDGAETELVIGTHPLAVRTLHLALRRDLPDVDQILARFNAEIGRMMDNGTLHRLLGSYGIRSVPATGEVPTEDQ